MWALGDYHRFALATVWQLGPVLVEACHITPGQRVLDVAAGTGNVAIRAAKAGARVVACDLTPSHFEAGRHAAATEGVEIEWREADAEALPFADGDFDVVTSCFGAMFAPDHQAVARELVRVCRPAGVIGLLSFTADGISGEFFKLLGEYAPPPPAGALPPVLWGQEAHVRELLGDHLASIEMTRRTYVETAASAHEYCDLFRKAFGPLVAIRGALAGDPERLAALDRGFETFVARSNRAASPDRVEIPYDYLQVIGRKPARTS